MQNASSVWTETRGEKREKSMKRIILSAHGGAVIAAVLCLLFMNSCGIKEPPYPVPAPDIVPVTPGTLEPPPAPLPMDTPL